MSSVYYIIYVTIGSSQLTARGSPVSIIPGAPLMSSVYYIIYVTIGSSQLTARGSPVSIIPGAPLMSSVYYIIYVTIGSSQLTARGSPVSIIPGAPLMSSVYYITTISSRTFALVILSCDSILNKLNLMDFLQKYIYLWARFLATARVDILFHNDKQQVVHILMIELCYPYHFLYLCEMDCYACFYEYVFQEIIPVCFTDFTCQ